MAKRDLKIGRKYAAALFQAVGPAQAESALDVVSKIAENIETSAELRQALINPVVGPKDKKAVIQKLAGETTPELTSFISLVVEAGRTINLPDIAEALRTLVEELKKLARVTVTSRFEATETRRAEIKTALTKAFGKEPQVTFETSPEVLGGLTIKLGDTELDGSFAGAIQRLAGVFAQA
jgi:F-type H+-transporting ATPase subunit delta